MKTIEEKAKAYDEALSRAESLYDNESSSADTLIACEAIFPELTESEDEKVRKEIKQLIQGMHDADPRKERWLTWLEKQGEQNIKQVSIWKHWKDGICGNGEGKPIYLIKNGDDYSISSVLGYECDYIDLSDLDKLMLPEKQGEQKPYGQRKECLYCQFNYFDECKGFCQMKRDEQKSAWNEEDECYMTECINAIATKDGWSFEEKRKTKHWLESLKQRIGR